MVSDIAGRAKARVLVGITSFGSKNIEFLRRVVQAYRAMDDFEVDIIVFSDKPKELGRDVEVVVGLPNSNPWSLGFAHKAVFAARSESYDLFVYSEDDVEITATNIRAFVEVTESLNADEIAGFLLCEKDEAGTCSLPNVHGPFHWRPESVRQRGKYTIAEFTNEHSAFYLLTREQLKKAIASGGYLRQPYRGRYDMLCTASTDPYTSCGFRKVICISRLNNFIIRHLPNRYHGVHTVSLDDFKKQVDALLAIRQGEHPATALCEVEPRSGPGRWAKNYYEETRHDVLSMVPAGVHTVLSIGCGWGDTEAALAARDIQVTALPLDSVIGASTAARGIKMVYGSLSEALASLEDDSFDCVFATDLLHLLEQPALLVEQCARVVRPGGTLLLAGPNFDYLPLTFDGRRTNGDAPSDFATTGINRLKVTELDAILKNAGFNTEAVAWQAAKPSPSVSGSTVAESWPRRIASGIWRQIGSMVARTTCNAGSPRCFFAERWIMRASIQKSNLRQIELSDRSALDHNVDPVRAAQI